MNWQETIEEMKSMAEETKKLFDPQYITRRGETYHSRIEADLERCINGITDLDKDEIKNATAPAVLVRFSGDMEAWKSTATRNEKSGWEKSQAKIRARLNL